MEFQEYIERLKTTFISDVYADEIKKAEFKTVVLLGMGGSSLCPEVFQKTFGSRKGFPELVVCDSTDPDHVRDIEKKINIRKTLRPLHYLPSSY